MNVSAIYSSQFKEQKILQRLLENTTLDVTIDDRLIELDMGKFTGMAYDEIFKIMEMSL